MVKNKTKLLFASKNPNEAEKWGFERFAVDVVNEQPIPDFGTLREFMTFYQSDMILIVGSLGTEEEERTFYEYKNENYSHIKLVRTESYEEYMTSQRSEEPSMLKNIASDLENANYTHTNIEEAEEVIADAIQKKNAEKSKAEEKAREQQKKKEKKEKKEQEREEQERRPAGARKKRKEKFIRPGDRAIVIGVGSIHEGSGSRYTALLVANYLADLGCTVALAAYSGNPYTGKCSTNKRVLIQELANGNQQNDIIALRNANVDFVVISYGRLYNLDDRGMELRLDSEYSKRNEKRQLHFTADWRILVGFGNGWHIDSLDHFYENTLMYANTYFLLTDGEFASSIYPTLEIYDRNLNVTLDIAKKIYEKYIL